MGQMAVFSGPERRRRWSDEDRLRILTEAFSPGTCVARVAQQHDASRHWPIRGGASCARVAPSRPGTELSARQFAKAMMAWEAGSARPGPAPAIVVDLARGTRVSIAYAKPAIELLRAVKACSEIPSTGSRPACPSPPTLTRRRSALRNNDSSSRHAPSARGSHYRKNLHPNRRKKAGGRQPNWSRSRSCTASKRSILMRGCSPSRAPRAIARGRLGRSRLGWKQPVKGRPVSRGSSEAFRHVIAWRDRLTIPIRNEKSRDTI